MGHRLPTRNSLVKDKGGRKGGRKGWSERRSEGERKGEKTREPRKMQKQTDTKKRI